MDKSSNFAPASVTCNIDHVEIARRKALAVASGLTLLLLIPIYLYFGGVLIAAVLLFSFLTAINYLQARRRFCVAFAIAGIRNDHDGKVERVLGSEKQQQRAFILKIVIDSLVTAVIISTTVFIVGWVI